MLLAHAIPTLLLAVLFSQVSAQSTSQPASFANSTLFRSTMLARTNVYRTLYNASTLAWNSTLAAFAQSHAAGCVFAHSGGPYGENIAAGFANASATVGAWAGEAVHYDWSDPGFSETTGHFTQLVWKDTTMLGCGAVLCSGTHSTPGWFVVCEYWPRGNVIGSFAQEVDPLDQRAARALFTSAGVSGREKSVVLAVCAALVAFVLHL